MNDEAIVIEILRELQLSRYTDRPTDRSKYSNLRVLEAKLSLFFGLAVLASSETRIPLQLCFYCAPRITETLHNTRQLQKKVSQLCIWPNR